MRSKCKQGASWRGRGAYKIYYQVPWPIRPSAGGGNIRSKEMAGSHIPERILNRSKMCSGAPMASWMRVSLKPVFERRVTA